MRDGPTGENPGVGGRLRGDGPRTLPNTDRTVEAITAVKVIKVLGTSEESWEEAAEEAVIEASETIDDIHGVEIEEWTADIDGGEVTQYKATVEVAFPVHVKKQESRE